ncbi:MAG: DUF4388 domain-containing protein [Acidobacteriota bacterium]|nr:DUF4388 domain-containing protein [Acidobacteriota bacterium]
MSLTGSLNSMDFAELLQWLARGRKTGMLLVAKKGTQKQVYFRDGRIIATASSDHTEYLGHFLVSHGFLDELTLAKAIEMQSGNRMLLGKILTTLGAIGEVELEQMLRLKAEESIYEIFTWADADFRFVEDELPAFEMVPISLDVQTLVLRGAKRLDDWTRIRQLIPSKHCVPVSVGNLVAPEGDPGAEQILQLVNDDRTIEEIALDTHSSEFYVCRVLWDQIRLGHLKVVRPRAAATIEPAVPNGEAIDAAALIEVALRHLDEGHLLRALRHTRAACDLDPESRAAKTKAREIEDRIRRTLAEHGLGNTAVPHLSANLADLSRLEISAEAGFILSRINGTYDLGTILKISPIPTLETQVVLWQLLEAGHIYLD